MLVGVPKAFSLFAKPGKTKAPACPQKQHHAGRDARLLHCSLAFPRKSNSGGASDGC